MRLVQFHDKAVEPPGDARSEAWFIYHLGRRLKALYAGSTDPRDRGLQALTWDYPTEGAHADPVIDEVVKEINGWTVADRQQVNDFTDAERRRQHGLRLLDLQRHLPRRRARTWARGRTGRRLGQPGLGLRLAGQPAHPLQPRQRRPAGPPLVRAQEVYLVGRRAEGKWTGYDVPDFPRDEGARHARPARRQGHGRPFRRRPVHHAWPTARAGCSCPAA